MTTTSAAREPGPGSLVDLLPISKSLPIPDDSLVTRDIFPLEGETRVKPLQSPGGMTARVHSSKRGEGGERRRTDRRIAAALAADGGKAYAL
ncbi:hypothetical protein ABZX62_12945 [Streptomyces flavidovirens]|uniref:hypothetical protein n=1 Tax=Streptomyces flavidovirens TaxID=67298 RepID=UPI0033BE5D5E